MVGDPGPEKESDNLKSHGESMGSRMGLEPRGCCFPELLPSPGLAPFQQGGGAPCSLPRPRQTHFFPLSSLSKQSGSAAREEPMPVGGPSAGCLGCTARGQRQGQEGHGPRLVSRHVPKNELIPGSPKNTRNLRPGVGPAGFPRKKKSL